MNVYKAGVTPLRHAANVKVYGMRSSARSPEARAMAEKIYSSNANMNQRVGRYTKVADQRRAMDRKTNMRLAREEFGEKSSPSSRVARFDRAHGAERDRADAIARRESDQYKADVARERQMADVKAHYEALDVSRARQRHNRTIGATAIAVPVTAYGGYKIATRNKGKQSVAKRGELRETTRSGTVGALGALVVTRRARPALKWGAAGAAMGSLVDVVHHNKRKTTKTELLHVEKRNGDQLYRRESRINPWRATEALAGVTLLTAGGARLKMVGGALKAGTKLPGNKSLPFERAQSLRNMAQHGTRNVGPTLRRNDTMSGAIDLIPRRARPAAASLAGAAMISNSRPVRRDRYVPVNR